MVRLDQSMEVFCQKTNTSFHWRYLAMSTINEMLCNAVSLKFKFKLEKIDTFDLSNLF